MADIERVVSNADSCCDGNKIKTHFAQVIVHGTAEKPYYEILYFDTEDRTYHIGFGSYCLDYVFEWLSNEFEIVEAEQEAVVAPVRHGRWIIKKRHTISSNPYMDDDYFASATCSECNFCVESKIASFSFPKLNTTSYCPNCGAKMDLEG